MNSTTTSLVVAAIGAVSGLLPVVITLVVKWAEQRRDKHTLKRAIDISHKRLEFLNLWIRTQQLICSDKDFEKLTREVSEELLALRNEIQIPTSIGEQSVLSREDVLFLESHQKISKWKIAVLGYLPKSVAGWSFHLLFYMAFGACVLLTGFMIFAQITFNANVGLYPFGTTALSNIYGPLVIAFMLTYILFWAPARFIA